MGLELLECDLSTFLLRFETNETNLEDCLWWHTVDDDDDREEEVEEEEEEAA